MLTVCSKQLAFGSAVCLAMSPLRLKVNTSMWFGWTKFARRKLKEMTGDLFVLDLVDTADVTQKRFVAIEIDLIAPCPAKSGTKI